MTPGLHASAQEGVYPGRLMKAGFLPSHGISNSNGSYPPALRQATSTSSNRLPEKNLLWRSGVKDF